MQTDASAKYSISEVWLGVHTEISFVELKDKEGTFNRAVKTL